MPLLLQDNISIKLCSKHYIGLTNFTWCLNLPAFSDLVRPIFKDTLMLEIAEKVNWSQQTCVQTYHRKSTWYIRAELGNVVGIGRTLPGISARCSMEQGSWGILELPGNWQEFGKVFTGHCGQGSWGNTLIWAVYPRNWQDIARNSARCLLSREADENRLIGQSINPRKIDRNLSGKLHFCEGFTGYPLGHCQAYSFRQETKKHVE